LGYFGIVLVIGILVLILRSASSGRIDKKKMYLYISIVALSFTIVGLFIVKLLKV
jgi:hypothetical protein